MAERELTERQVEVLELIAAGRSNAGIAADLDVQWNTARNHVSEILRRLGVGTRHEAVEEGVRRGLIGAERVVARPAREPRQSKGRRPRLLDDEQSIAVGRRYQAQIPVGQLAIEFGVSPATIYQALARAGVKRTNVRPPRTRRPSEAELALARRKGLTSWDAAPRPPAKAHRIEDISYRREWVLCSCGVEITAPPDQLEPERHQPLVDAWQSHRRSVGARVLSVAQDAAFHRAYS